MFSACAPPSLFSEHDDITRMVGTTFYVVYIATVIALQLPYCLNKIDMDEWERPHQ